jgi:uncharacterized membrane protein
MMLISGVILFAAVHLVPSLAPGVKTAWRGKLGEGGYKGTFSLLLLASFALMIMGWRSSQPELYYVTGPGVRHGAMGVIALAMLLLVISNRPSRLRRWISHPQLTGVLLWALAHLSMNGDSRSVVLFGALALWAAVEILAISRRDGPVAAQEPPALATEVVSIVIAAVLVVVLMFAHPYLSGMPVF